MVYEMQNFQDGQVLTAQQLNHIEEGVAAAAAGITALEEAVTPAATEKMELIQTITITEAGTRSAVFDDNFCLKKFNLRVKITAADVPTTTLQVSIMEKRSNGTWNSFSSSPQSLIVNNAVRYGTYWGNAVAGNPVEYYAVVSAYHDLMTAVTARPYPVVCEKGLTRVTFSALTEGTQIPVGSTFELWGVRV